MSFLFLVKLAAVTALKDSVNGAVLDFAFFLGDDFDGVLTGDASDDPSSAAFLFLTGDGEITRVHLELSGDLEAEGASLSCFSAGCANRANWFLVKTMAFLERKYLMLD